LAKYKTLEGGGMEGGYKEKRQTGNT